jgi:hypothetical protein
MSDINLSESPLLKMNLKDASLPVVVKAVRATVPNLTLKQSIDLARLFKGVYTYGTIRGKVVNNP